ncbi:zinc finger protein [Macleaya cordata]|uniref:Zinc finger protein n=1 Tax=Macleaya cordata TaxID=56857 RepID=A0A200Q257_MACCD|nr:zinc finger protein [Macleaya cordata]
MPVDLENSSAMSVSTASGEASASSSGNQTAPVSTTTKKKRNLPGMPDPNAEVIALSPKTLMATNRFVCEICNKGFQRDQNLQLHRRGHNLPWKLRQRTSKEIRKRVYVCPEPSCVHHDPSRALGDLTGIKKHFCRKHGEKKWKCDKCSKKYAVQSDWKAHLKTCGTREYRCDCGTLFSRRDSFITHRAFCDALAEESAKAQTVPNSKSEEVQKLQVVVSPSSPPPPPPPPLPPPSTTDVLPDPNQNSELPEKSTGVLQHIPPSTCVNGSSSSPSNVSSSNGMFTSIFASSTMAGTMQPQTSAFSDLICAMTRSERPTNLELASATEPTSLCLSSNSGSTLFAPLGQDRHQYAPSPHPTMSATALLQKAAQMGAAATNASLLRGFGISVSSSSGERENMQWSHTIDNEPGPAAPGLGIGLPCDGAAGLTELMMGPSSLFGPRPTTLDLLGLGIGAGGASKGGLSALITSIGGGGGGFDVAAAAAATYGGGNLLGKTWERDEKNQ